MNDIFNFNYLFNYTKRNQKWLLIVHINPIKAPI